MILSDISVPSLHDWVSQELICIGCRPVAWFPWTRDGLRRWDVRGQVCECVCVCVVGVCVMDMDWGRAEKGTRNEMSLTLGCCLISRDPQSSQTVGSWAALPAGPDPFHIAASLARHTCLCGVWGGYRLLSIMTFNQWPTIVIPPPFLSQESLILLTIPLFHISVPQMLLPSMLLLSSQDYWKDLYWR